MKFGNIKIAFTLTIFEMSYEIWKYLDSFYTNYILRIFHLTATWACEENRQKMAKWRPPLLKSGKTTQSCGLLERIFAKIFIFKIDHLGRGPKSFAKNFFRWMLVANVKYHRNCLMEFVHFRIVTVW